jgi:hypothetical protein
MYKILFIILLSTCLITSCTKKTFKAHKIWSSTNELKVPESVMFDSKRNILYVSNINGKPTEKNNKGFLSKLSLNGKIIKLQWVKGFNAPKGMGIYGNTLYVTDINRIHAIDIPKGKIIKTVKEQKAKFLNDIAISNSGNVYISDMMTGNIHILKNNKLEIFVNLKDFEGANGLLMKQKNLLAGSKTGIVSINLSTKKTKLLVPVKEYGMIDGLKRFNSNSFIMSNWKGKTQIVSLKGKVSVLIDTTKEKIQSADFEYIASKNLIIIPTFFNNKVIAYKIK